VKKEPLGARKVSFGCRDASKRDEFTDHIQTERYRWQLKREMSYVDKQIADAQAPPAAQWQGDPTGAYHNEAEVDQAIHAHEMAAASAGATTTTTSRMRGAKVRAAQAATLRRGPPATMASADETFTTTSKSFFQNTSGRQTSRILDPPVNPGGVPPPKRYGPYSTTACDLGRGVAGLATKPRFGLKTAAKDFYDGGHIDHQN